MPDDDAFGGELAESPGDGSPAQPEQLTHLVFGGETTLGPETTAQDLFEKMCLELEVERNGL
jgi:hypothetical protein